MKTKTLISRQESRKTNPELRDLIREAKKREEWLKVAGVLAGPRKNWKSVNLGQINNKTKENDKIVVLGKVLSQGEINKKIKITAFGFSETAKKKLKNSDCEFNAVSEEIRKNPRAEGLRIFE